MECSINRRTRVGAGLAALIAGRARAQPVFRLGLTPVFLDNDAAVIEGLRRALSRGMGREIELVQRREFKQEEVEFITKRVVRTAQASRDIGIHATVLLRWVCASETDGRSAFQGHGKLTPEQRTVRDMRREVARLKAERIRRKTYRTRKQDRADVFDYVERFYNAKRRHSTNGYLSPMTFEERAVKA